jgi:hypothetical protein
MIYNNNSQPVGPYYFFLYEVVKDETKLEGKIQADLKRVEVFISSDCQHHSNFNRI